MSVLESGMKMHLDVLKMQLIYNDFKLEFRGKSR
jgi:hypothetical protein